MVKLTCHQVMYLVGITERETFLVGITERKTCWGVGTRLVRREIKKCKRERVVMERGAGIGSGGSSCERKHTTNVSQVTQQ